MKTPTSQMDRRKSLHLLSRALLLSAVTNPSYAAASDDAVPDDVEGIKAVTQSDLGKATRRSFIRGARLADKLDEKWERFSDSLRDKKKCDPNTNRRLFDNGFRRDGSRVGDPVLGSLCTPEPLRDFDDDVASLVLDAAEQEVKGLMGGVSSSDLEDKVKEVEMLVALSFQRATAGPTARDATTEEKDQEEKRFAFNRSLYTRMRAYGDLLSPNYASNFEMGWGKRLLPSFLPPEGADRKFFRSPFPSLSPEEIDDLPYDNGSLLDALGILTAALQTMKGAGLIGQYEISIPTDDYGEVITVAVDDDVSLGAQMLLRGQKGRKAALAGSPVVAILRASLDERGIVGNVDSFFLDPSTTKQDVYNPTQLLVNVSNLRMK